MTGTKESVRIATVIEVMQGARRDEVAKKYGVDPTSISHWKRIFAERSEIKSLIAMNRIKSKRLQSLSSMQSESRSQQSEELATLKRQLLEQEKEIVDLHQRLDIANTMIEVAEKSMLWLKFTTRGVQCHASRPNLGKNAFLAASALVLELDGLKERFPLSNPIFEPEVSTFVPTKKEANIPNVNTIPGEDIFYCDCRILPEIPLSEVLGEIEKRMKKVEALYGVSITYEILQRVESKPTSEHAALVSMLKGVVKDVYGVDAEPVGIGGGTVAAYLRNAGFDAAVWARIDDSAHMPNEYCLLSNVKGDAKVMALAMLA